jgi:membrane protein DedA with SNARE-associated domain
MKLEQLIINYGYIIILIGTFLEGETVLILAGFLVHRGHLELPLVIAAAFTGSVAGDQFFFLVGRSKGIAFLDKHPSWKSKSDKVFNMLHKHQTWIIIGFRFLYGIRTITPFLIGTSGVKLPRFLILNMIGAAVWSVLLASLGYVLGQTIELVLGDVKRYELHTIVAIVVAGFLFWLINFFISKHKETQGSLVHHDR